MFQEQQAGQYGQSEMDMDRTTRNQRENKGYREQIQDTAGGSKSSGFESEFHQKPTESWKQKNDMI